MANSPTSQGRSPWAWSKADPGFGLVVLALLSLLACGAAAVWMHYSVAARVLAAGDALRAEIVGNQSVSDALVTLGLVQGLAGGDYGEVQEMLTRYQGTGYLTNAVVINASGKGVAIVGGVEGLQVGDTVTPQMLASGKLIDLTLGAQKLGQLLVFAKQKTGPDTLNKEVAGMRIATILVALLALISAGAVIWLRQEFLRAVDAARKGSSRSKTPPMVADLRAFSEQDLRDIGQSTMQDIETELRKRVAASRERRVAPNTEGNLDPNRVDR
ncbi:MAG: hypothetical protein ACKVQQ_23240 [Burkholderiales bacterium]